MAVVGVFLKSYNSYADLNLRPILNYRTFSLYFIHFLYIEDFINSMYHKIESIKQDEKWF